MLDWGGSGISQGVTKPWWRYPVCHMHDSISGVCNWDLFNFWKVLYIQQWSTSAKKYWETHVSDFTSIAFDVRSLDLKDLL